MPTRRPVSHPPYGPSLDGETVAGEESDGESQVAARDQVATAVGDGSTGAFTDHGGGFGNRQAAGRDPDLECERGILHQGLRLLVQEGGQGAQRIAHRYLAPAPCPALARAALQWAPCVPSSARPAFIGQRT